MGVAGEANGVTAEEVADYYGKVLQSSEDLKTNACCLGSSVPAAQKKILAKIHDEVISKFYGCGSPVPDQIEGAVVLDLGCGTGRDVYLAAGLVGPQGHVIGVDMTDEQLAVATKHVDYHTKAFELPTPNVEFKKGFIEDLKAIGVADNSVDVVISNCVINLSTNKEKCFSEIFRILKEGGELYFSDVFSDRRIPKELKDDKVLYGECLSGALYLEDFRRIMQRVGFTDVRTMSTSPITIDNADVERRVGAIKFYSVTVRAFKLSSLEDKCENFGQEATYLGGIAGHEDAWTLDDHHVFPRGTPVAVCGNTADMLSLTRFRSCFRVTPRGPHSGLFPCGPAPASTGGDSACCVPVPGKASCC